MRNAVDMLMKPITVGGILVETLDQIQAKVENVGFWWLVFGHMNGASHGIISHVYLVNNCGLYLKERGNGCMYCT